MPSTTSPPYGQYRQSLLKASNGFCQFRVFRVSQRQPDYLLRQHALAAGQVDDSGVVLLRLCQPERHPHGADHQQHKTQENGVKVNLQRTIAHGAYHTT
ncbi:MAG TPA: hypothetical protein PLD25_19410 [Chloroflexota bacterium]|nr:hypothetical protein [Chloroflexota bacterium]HUM69136.1 hypothetical protein [Chloroflexota bacterium]